MGPLRRRDVVIDVRNHFRENSGDHGRHVKPDYARTVDLVDQGGDQGRLSSPRLLRCDPPIRGVLRDHRDCRISGQ